METRFLDWKHNFYIWQKIFRLETEFLIGNLFLSKKYLFVTSRPLSQLAQRRCDNVVKHRDTVNNESSAEVGFRRCDNVALRRYQNVATTLLQRRHNM